MFDLSRFAHAQDAVYATALSELEAGRKQSHWMWFIFPQLEGLGHSPTARFYGVSGLAEAHTYLADPVLGPRLKECVSAALGHRDRTAHEIFGSPDDLKFRSCLTLFEFAAPDEPIFGEALGAFYGGDRDQETLRMLR
jgi:uncharacterized protein (DUF1810 family)